MNASLVSESPNIESGTVSPEQIKDGAEKMAKLPGMPEFVEENLPPAPALAE